MRRTAQISILDLMDRLQRWFSGDSWAAWHVVLKALFALPLSQEELNVYSSLTRRPQPPAQPAREAWLFIGRRGGKSIIAALLAVYFAVFVSYKAILAPGERGVVMVIASDRRQARVVFRYIKAFFTLLKLFADLVERKTQEAIHLTNGITIEIHTSSFRAVRGYTVVCAICDEVAFWPSEESANPAAEILNGLRPAMATVPNGLLLCITTPYARRDEAWRTYEKHYGRNESAILVVQADTLTMNPSIPRSIIEAAYEQDGAVASAEYGAQFRLDIESLVAREAVKAVVVPGRYELPPMPEVAYRGFVDPSGGSQDSMTLAIAHHEQGVTVLDLVREVKPPFSPEAVTKEFCDVLKAYRLDRVTGDRYGGEWPREQFRKYGIEYQLCQQPKSDLYRELLPLLNSRALTLLDLPRLTGQLCALERRTGRGGKDSVDHGPNAHDDVVNAATGALVLIARDATRPEAHLWFTAESVDARTVDAIQLESDAEHAAKKAEAARVVNDAIQREGFYWPR